MKRTLWFSNPDRGHDGDVEMRDFDESEEESGVPNSFAHDAGGPPENPIISYRDRLNQNNPHLSFTSGL